MSPRGMDGPDDAGVVCDRDSTARRDCEGQARKAKLVASDHVLLRVNIV